MSLIAEIKRRKVFRVSAAYAVVAWGLAQVADLVLENTAAPSWVMQVILLVLALGFPLAVILAWAFEVTPEGVRRTERLDAGTAPPALGAQDRLLIALLIIVIAVASYQVVQVGRSDGSQTVAQEPAGEGEGASAAEAATLSGPPDASIAVLPFADMSPSGDQGYFSDGIAEEILNVLAAIEGLKVASRTSSFLLRDQGQPIPAIAESLGVAHVLEGSVRKSGERIRITAQLIEAGRDAHLWSETYDRELNADNLFAIQDEIASAIVRALDQELQLSLDEDIVVAPSTGNLDAYEIYLQAREMFRDRSDLPEAFRLFERAVELDPGFARAWEGMAAVGAVIEDWGFVDRPYSEMAATAANRALDLDPGLSMPWAVRSQLETLERPIDFAEAERLIDRALEADPNNATALLWRSIHHLHLGFFDRALADQDRCLEIDPAYENCRRFKALTLLLNGQTEDALTYFLAGVENGFVTNRAFSFIRPLLDRGDKALAMAIMAAGELSVEQQHALLEFHRTGRPVANVLEIVEGSERYAKYHAMTLLNLGAYALAAEAQPMTESTLIYWDSTLPGLRNSEAFKRILRRFGVPTYWRKHGFPPQCRPIVSESGEDDFECD